MDWTVIGAFALSSIFVYSTQIYGWYKLLGKEIDLKDYKIYIALIILVLAGTFLNYAVVTYLKMILVFILFFVVNYFFVSKHWIKCFVSVIIMQGLTMISELFIALVLSIFVGEHMNNFINTPLGIIVMNLGVTILLFGFLRLKVFEKMSKYLITLFGDMEKNNLFISCFATIGIGITFLIMSHMKLPELVMVTIGSLLIIIYVIAIIRLASVQEKFNKINDKYETSLSSLQEYEDIMDQYKVDNHENKNQLLTIRNMVKAKDKTVIKYIDKLVDNKIKDNENIFYKTSKIPEGGLRATIYSKLCKMKDMGIEYSLEIAKDVRTVELIKIGDVTMLNICKIAGVFLDNAIEAVEGLDEKDIIVEIFVMNNNLCIEVSNNYKEEIILDKISNKGYTTKGKGHGYGLSLVGELIKQDSNLENEKEISKDLFTQRLKIKM